MPRPVQVYDFTAFSRRTPTAQPPGDRLDAQFRAHADAIAEIQGIVDAFRLAPAPSLDELITAAAVELRDIRQQAQNAVALADEARVELGRLKVAAQQATEAADRAEARLAVVQAQTAPPPGVAPYEPTLPPSSLYVGAGGPYAGDDKGATATSADYAQVSIDWAEHMPDTIPPNTLTVTNISGDHWSSRWWASRAASIVSAIGAVGAIPGTQGVFTEALVVTGGGIPNLSKTPAGPVLLVMNGVAFLPVGAQPPFAVSGKAITWLSPIYALFDGTEVSVWYPYAP